MTTAAMLNHSTRPRFSWAYDGSAESSRAYFDQPITETANFVVVPSLGSIVPGWVLVVPKCALTTFRDLPSGLHDECRVLVNEMCAAVRTKFGSVAAFEHGGDRGSPTACGVDQAHLHLAPLNFDVVAACEDDHSMEWQRFSSFFLPFDAVYGSGEYLYAANGDATLVGRVHAPVSQWFRRLIASRCGLADQWNYREYAFHSNIRRTIQAFQNDVD